MQRIADKIPQIAYEMQHVGDKMQLFSSEMLRKIHSSEERKVHLYRLRTDCCKHKHKYKHAGFAFQTKDRVGALRKVL